ncbi:Uncharacterized protein dnm_040590 [Desulfonema magnum]|uniref:Uncharacterized protein n=1 Tax=Desulfonema magnum TaxID=45655 RepID=A0A975GNQ4_9BACT|nr:Uncharacterized protein dnm_040590 [Desulfonema magnum]
MGYFFKISFNQFQQIFRIILTEKYVRILTSNKFAATRNSEYRGQDL